MPFGSQADTRDYRLSLLSHRLVSWGRILVDFLDSRQTLTCVSGLRWTHRMLGTRLRIKRLGVRVPPSAPRPKAGPIAGNRPFPCPYTSKYSKFLRCGAAQ